VKDVLTIPEAAEPLRMTGRHLYRLIEAGESPVRVIKIGSRLRVLRSDLERFLSGEIPDAS
jgi:excisionase family DNA binding protein